jgi:hypothetical protein
MAIDSQFFESATATKEWQAFYVLTVKQQPNRTV